ncbi:hypothetical protein E3Q06_02296 [Wallemia mellicola]|nr:hypothetical protein E3Q21_02307 [Wallemia mellicola]TIB87819.1 hypothetical protein E3Q20_02302 [Wallemia mellicola]TIC40184.1 hypothetical protein E3Q07_02319 [Wallemia mellicola]TIC48583.1 hypothetical protein E3Q06_02296 [Wallemia mellicola]TIC54885.1 hypothetical protein E3Q04_02074 [Wallemia mellicola]
MANNLSVGLSKNIQADILNTNSALTATLRTGDIKTVSKLLSPLSFDEVPTSRFLGLNYRDHAEECKLKIPTQPILFYKPSTALAGPGDAIPIPRVCQSSDEHLVDYEAEFIAVIGRAAKNVSKKDALNYILGYSIGNDVSTRKHQFGSSQWGFSKSFDGSAPWGPALVSADEITDPQNIPIGTKLNGTIMQNSSTSKQIFSLAETIAFLSQGTTLLPGSLIWTGTPMGVGFTRNPPAYLKHGDKVEIFSNNQIGTLVNNVANDE